MASLGDLKLSHQVFLRAYSWRRAEASPAARLRRPLAACRVALVSSAGLTAPGDEPFDPGIRGGDPSLRWLRSDVDLGALRENHRSDAFDHAGLSADRNLAFPLDRLREVAASGLLGELAPRHASLMGSITAPGRLLRESLPALLEGMRQDEVDVALMVPV